MKLSVRNKLRGTIVEVKKGRRHDRRNDPCQNRCGRRVVTAPITNKAPEELQLGAGQTAYGVIKASDVMVGVD